jgi:hypothetical protein
MIFQIVLRKSRGMLFGYKKPKNHRQMVLLKNIASFPNRYVNLVRCRTEELPYSRSLSAV